MDEVTAIVNSHLHFDHCGNNRLFPGIPIFVQEDEWAAAEEPHYTVTEWVHFPGACYVTFRGRRRISDHLELVPTPGHTSGHQSLVVHTTGGLELIVAQAAYTAAEFDASGPSGSGSASPDGTESAEAYARSLATLYGFGAHRAYFSHDPTVWTRPASETPPGSRGSGKQGRLR
jgi:glyoxylase-like metal-dependent hydrolase (beta-lactamase superfamily II)